MAMPRNERGKRFEILERDVQDILSTDPVLRTLPINAAYPVSGGVAHLVYCIDSNRQKFYLKIRGDHFAAIPSISCNPADITNEYEAIRKFSRAAPEHFPHIVTFNPERHYLAVTDVVGDGQKLEDVLARGEKPDGLFTIYGQTLSAIQRVTASIREPVRPGGDEEYYRTVLGHRFGYRRHPVLDAAVEKLGTLPHRQLIMADPAPKNMGIRKKNTRLTFFDLETAHQGNPEFDYAYGLAHTLLHTMPRVDDMQTATMQFLEGYGPTWYDQKLVTELTLGIILYRLHSIVPYPVALSSSEKQRLELHLGSMLHDISGKESWQEIVERITKL